MTADLGARGLRSVMTDVTAALAQHPPPTDIRVELGGQYASQQAAFGALVLVLGLAAASVVGVMVVQFASFVEPLIVLLAAPLSFVGGIGAGSELPRPLALGVVGGLALSTAVTLFAVPALLVAIRGRGYVDPSLARLPRARSG